MLLMKRLSILAFFLIAFPSFLSAQLEKGTISPGGGASASLLYTDDADQFSIVLQPSLGYFVNDQIMIGSSISLGYSFAESSNIGVVGIGPYVRYYLASTVYPSQWFLALHTEFAGNLGDGMNGTTASIYPQVGLSSFLNSSIALDVQLGPNFVIQESQSTLNLLANVGLRIFIGPDLFAARSSATSNFTPGSLLVGGSRLNVNYNPGDGGEIFAGFSPHIGVFLSNKSSLGVRAGFDYRKDRFSPFKVVNYSFIPFFRHYLNTGHFATFAEVGGGISGFTISGNTIFDNLSESGFQATAGLGANLFLTENAALEIMLNYRYDEYIQVSRLGLDFGFQFVLR